jgi:hypothetical protein
MPDRPSHRRGRFAAGEFPLVLREMAARLGSGRIRVAQHEVTRYLWLADGSVRAITSSLEQEKLGGWLVARGLLDPDVVNDALVRKTGTERFGRVLVARGLIDDRRLQEELESRTITIAARMLREEGEFEPEPGVIAEPDSVVIDLGPVPLFVAAARRLPDIGQFHALAREGRWIATPAGRADNAGVELMPFEAFVLSQLAAPATVDELGRRAGQAGPQVSRALLVLFAAGLAVPPGQAAVPAHGGRGFARSRPDLPGANPQLRNVLEQLDPDSRPAFATQLVGHAVRRPPTREQLRQAEREKTIALRMLLTGDDPLKAYRLLSRAVEINPDALALVRLAEIELANPLWRGRALDRLKQATELLPTCTSAWLALANYWGARGQPDKQRRCLERILTYDRTNPDVRHALSLLDRQR